MDLLDTFGVVMRVSQALRMDRQRRPDLHLAVSRGPATAPV